MANQSGAPQLRVEDAVQAIIRYLRNPPATERSRYGYGVYLPNIAFEYYRQAGMDWRAVEQIWRPVSPVFYAAAWELCRRGILRPGIREAGLQVTDNGSGGDGYSITPFGVAELGEVRNFELMTAITKSAWSERLSGSARPHAGDSSRLRW